MVREDGELGADYTSFFLAKSSQLVKIRTQPTQLTLLHA